MGRLAPRRRFFASGVARLRAGPVPHSQLPGTLRVLAATAYLPMTPYFLPTFSKASSARSK